MEQSYYQRQGQQTSNKESHPQVVDGVRAGSGDKIFLVCPEQGHQSSQHTVQCVHSPHYVSSQWSVHRASVLAIIDYKEIVLAIIS